MIKKLLTTKPHLVVFFLGVIALINFLWSSYFATWTVTRTIGWGWDISRLLWWIMPPGFVSILFFALVYWIFSKEKKLFPFGLVLLQVLAIICYLVFTVILFESTYAKIALLVSGGLFFIIICLLLFSKKTKGELP